MDLIQVGVDVSVSRKTKGLRQSAWRAAADRAARVGPADFYIEYKSLLCLGFINHQISSHRNSSILPRRCGLSPLFPSLHRNLSPFLIPFITIRVGSTPHLHISVIFWYRQFDSVQWLQIKVASLDPSLLRLLKVKPVDIVFDVKISAVSK